MNKYQIFANETVTSDVAPAITVDHNERLVDGIGKLREILGITELMAVPVGSAVKVYKTSKVNSPTQVAEGVTIPLTEIKREVASTVNMTLKKYRKQTTAEAIQQSGREIAINKTDDALVASIQKDIKGSFFTAMQPSSGRTAATAGASLQPALANMWAKAADKFEDKDVEMVYFVNPADIAPYLGSANIVVQNAFGMRYVEDFLGLGTVIISAGITSAAPIGTPKENLNGAYAPISGDVATEFHLTADATGLVGMVHTTKSENATIETLAMANVVFFPEAVDAIIKGTISA